MKNKILIFIFFLGLSFETCLHNQALANQMSSTQKIIRQSEIEREARILVEKGQYDEAIQKFYEALDPSLLNREGDKRGPLGDIVVILKWQKKFQEAYGKLQWFIKELPNVWFTKDEKQELEAYLESDKLHSAEPLHRHITYLRKKYQDILPPKRYLGGGGSSVATSQIIQIYDYIGDFNGGAVFVDGILNFFKQRDVEKYSKVRWGKGDEAYYKIRQAFEQDKKGGFKGCLDAKPGKVCMGRATKALIQSDYFPW